jgi:hypothetical protein
MALLRAFILGLASLLFAGPAAAEEGALPSPHVPSGQSSPARAQPLPVYRIPLRVHLGRSGRSPDEFRPMLEEINEIWLSQAGICFEMEIVITDERNRSGIDLWFEPVLSGGDGLNGYYRSDHLILVRDTPRLGPAARPARYPAARTAAHELGHSLGLLHRQDSDDNLMRSKTYGWQLNSDEIARAREAARAKALPDPSERICGAVRASPVTKTRARTGD